MGKVNLYDWSQAPDWAQWAATDANGGSFWFENKPILSLIMSIWKKAIGISLPCPQQINVEWQHSLEQRPK